MKQVLFVQPFTVSAKTAEQTTGNVIVLDVAFNAGSPQGKGTPEEQFMATTQAFIEALGPRLVGWVDHHPHTKWGEYEKDPRFILVSREVAPACPPLITPELVQRFPEVDTIVAHGDFDGVMSAVKWGLDGQKPYPTSDADSIAADTRVGELSEAGLRFDQAMKANLADDSIRQAMYAYLVHLDHEAIEKIIEAQTRYLAIQLQTETLARDFETVSKVAFVDATDSADPFDLTALLLLGQKKAAVAVVRNSQRGQKQITVAGPAGWNFVRLFELPGGMPNRVNLPDQEILPLIRKINEA